MKKLSNDNYIWNYHRRLLNKNDNDKKWLYLKRSKELKTDVGIWERGSKNVELLKLLLRDEWGTTYHLQLYKDL